MPPPVPPSLSLLESFWLIVLPAAAERLLSHWKILDRNVGEGSPRLYTILQDLLRLQNSNQVAESSSMKITDSQDLCQWLLSSSLSSHEALSRPSLDRTSSTGMVNVAELKRLSDHRHPPPDDELTGRVVRAYRAFARAGIFDTTASSGATDGTSKAPFYVLVWAILCALSVRPYHICLHCFGPPRRHLARLTPGHLLFIVVTVCVYPLQKDEGWSARSLAFVLWFTILSLPEGLRPASAQRASAALRLSIELGLPTIVAPRGEISTDSLLLVPFGASSGSPGRTSHEACLLQGLLDVSPAAGGVQGGGEDRAGKVGGATKGALLYRRFPDIVHEVLLKAGGKNQCMARTHGPIYSEEGKSTL